MIWIFNRRQEKCEGVFGQKSWIIKKFYSFYASQPEKVLIVNDQMFKGTSS